MTNVQPRWRSALPTSWPPSIQTSRRGREVKTMERQEADPSSSATPVALDDIHALIEQLEVQFEGDYAIRMEEEAPTDGCTAAANCTGSCPCEQERRRWQEDRRRWQEERRRWEEKRR